MPVTDEITAFVADTEHHYPEETIISTETEFKLPCKENGDVEITDKKLVIIYHPLFPDGDSQELTHRLSRLEDKGFVLPDNYLATQAASSNLLIPITEWEPEQTTIKTPTPPRPKDVNNVLSTMMAEAWPAVKDDFKTENKERGREYDARWYLASFYAFQGPILREHLQSYL